MKKYQAVLLIIASILISVIIATAFVNFGAIELGAIYYFVLPVLLGLCTVILFFPVDYYFKKHRNRITLAFVAVNMLAGLVMRLDFYFQFLNF